MGWLPKEISPLLLPLVQRAGEGMHVDGLVPKEGHGISASRSKAPSPEARAVLRP